MSDPDNWKRRRAKRAKVKAEKPRPMLQLTREHAWSCKFGLTGACTCTPTLRVEPLTGESLRRGYDNYMAWARAHLS